MATTKTADKCSDDIAISIFKRMLLMRYFEEQVIRLCTDGKFVGHYHVYTGQEATGAAVIETMEAEDLAGTTHRNHGHIVGRGGDPGRAFAEILGRATGLNQGRGGTLHMCDRSHGFLSTSAMVGGCVALATGAAYGLKGQGRVCVAFFGDGALEEGVVSECLNIAALWKLPIVYVCENNSSGAWGQQKGGYPTSVSAVEQFLQIPRCYGIKSAIVDGRDIDAVYFAAREALEYCRGGNGPFFLETLTERWPGSNPLWPELSTVTDIAMAWDPGLIAGEHSDWLEHHDPLLKAARRLIDSKVLGQREILNIDGEIRERIREAVEFAVSSPFPDSRTAYDLVFADRAAAA